MFSEKELDILKTLVKEEIEFLNGDDDDLVFAYKKTLGKIIEKIEKSLYAEGLYVEA